jgi:hypothetical protein
MESPWTRWSVVLGLAALCACSRDPPSAPRPFSITGHLRLTGYLVDKDAQFAGTLVKGDADGVPVELLHGDEIVGRTTTVGGIYRFSGLAPGGYVARSRVIGDLQDETNPMTIAVTDIECADTLRLVSRGDLYSYPNPFANGDTMRVSFSVPDTGWITVRIHDLDGTPVRTLLKLWVFPARHTVFWNCRDQRGQPLSGSVFWVTYVSDLETRAHLLIRQERSASPVALDPGGIEHRPPRR